MSGNSGTSTRARRVLVVDDESSIRQMVAFNLNRHGFAVYEAQDARSAQVSVVRHRPDLAIIDWMLPGTSGLDLTRSMKRDPLVSHVPIIMLTARTDELDKVVGLEAGADDYVTKPFSIRELLARINALLRRTSSRPTEALRANGLIVDSVSQQVSVGEQTVPLGPLEFRLLSFLIEHPERVHSRTQLLDRVWGAQTRLEERIVDVEICRLRRALGTFKCDRYIQTVHGAGYRFSTRTD